MSKDKRILDGGKRVDNLENDLREVKEDVQENK